MFEHLFLLQSQIVSVYIHIFHFTSFFKPRYSRELRGIRHIKKRRDYHEHLSLKVKAGAANFSG